MNKQGSTLVQEELEPELRWRTFLPHRMPSDAELHFRDKLSLGMLAQAGDLINLKKCHSPSCVCSVASVMSNSLGPYGPGSFVHGFLQAKILDVCHVLLQRVFPTQDRTRICLPSPALQADFLPTEPPGKPTL